MTERIDSSGNSIPEQSVQRLIHSVMKLDFTAELLKTEDSVSEIVAIHSIVTKSWVHRYSVETKNDRLSGYRI